MQIVESPRMLSCMVHLLPRRWLLSVCALALAGCPTPVQEDDDDDVDGGPDEVETCTDDSECGDGRFCLAGVCSDAECETKATCPADEVCNDGLCGAPPATCLSSEDCPGALVCDGFSNTCFDLGEGEGEGGEGEGEGGEGEGEGEGGEGEGEGEPGDAIDLDGYVLENRENNPVIHASILPNGTSLVPGQALVVGRNASRAEFEAFWGSLGDAEYLDANVGMTGVPIVNGDEKWALVDGGDLVDGVTIVGDSGFCYQRSSAGSAGSAGNWDEVPDVEGTPGVTDLPGTGTGLVISEWCDALGNGNFAFEFIELYYAP